jgi:hypothetical protein
MKTYTLEELQDKYIGIEGSEKRMRYEQELALELLFEVGFWKNLKQELGNKEYFCHSSELFERWWYNNKVFKKKIIRLAAEFLKNNEKYKEVYSNVAVLFGSLEELNYNLIRIDSCDYMIDKLGGSGDGRN